MKKSMKHKPERPTMARILALRSELQEAGEQSRLDQIRLSDKQRSIDSQQSTISELRASKDSYYNSMNQMEKLKTAAEKELSSVLRVVHSFLSVQVIGHNQELRANSTIDGKSSPATLRQAS